MTSRFASCLLVLGSNQGQRLDHLKKALRGLRRLPYSRLRKVSPIYETEPLGPSKQPYLNCAAILQTRLSPMGLLVELKRLEAQAGRRSGKRWGPRSLDIDIAAYGKSSFENAWLRIPHAGLATRSFYLVPLNDIAARFKIPKLGTISQILHRLKMWNLLTAPDAPIFEGLSFQP